MAKPLPLAAQIGLLTHQNRQKESEKRRDDVVFLNNSRAAIKLQQFDPAKQEFDDEFTRDPDNYMQLWEIAVDQASQNELHIFGIGPKVTFMPEMNQCPVCDQHYVFLRANIPSDLKTPPVCCYCATQVTGVQVTEFLRKAGWNCTSKGWMDPSGMGIEHEMFEEKEPSDLGFALLLIGNRLGLKVEALLVSMFPPFEPSLEPVKIAMTLAEHRRVAAAQMKASSEPGQPPRFQVDGKIPLGSGYEALAEMKAMWASHWQPTYARIAWRHHDALVIPSRVAEEMDRRGIPRISTDYLCPESGVVVTGNLEDLGGICNCGAQLETVRCDLAAEVGDASLPTNADVIFPHCPPKKPPAHLPQ